MNDKQIPIASELKEANKLTESSSLRIYTCSIAESCPLLKNKKCINCTIFGERCIYGGWHTKETHTKKSKSYRKELEELKALHSTLPKMQYFSHHCMVDIGEYVYLPYVHINHLDGKKDNIPFLAYSSVFTSGSYFMKKEDFTPEVIVKLLKLRPQALMGGEITNYQQEEVPAFVFHLCKTNYKLFDDVAKIYPKIMDIYNMAVCKAKLDNIPLTYLPIGTTNGFSLGNGVNVISWDGEYMVAEGDPEYKSLTPFKDVYFNGPITVKFKPELDKTKVTITNRDLMFTILGEHPELYKIENTK